MILESRETEIETSGNFKEFEFGIKQTDMDLVIEILRSKMYKNPIAAICREISSNSRDANRESQNESPIEIGFQDSPFITSETCIYFKDQGLGISPDRMADVFVNYGASTKRESNEFTGGFGLGAKTPFSYTDNFWINTVHSNVKYSYCAAIEEGKKGKIYLLNSEETTEESGTTIIVPIKTIDRSTFEEEVYKATIFWPQTPYYKNFRRGPQPIQLNKFFENDDFLIYDNNDFISGHWGLLLDGIYYPIDSSVMKFANRYMSSNLFIFKFNVGELTVSANREALQYDTKTQEKIQSKFDKLLTITKEQYEKEFETKTTWIDSYIYYQSQYRNNVYLKLLSTFLETEWLLNISKFEGLRFDRADNLFSTFQLVARQQSFKQATVPFFPINIKNFPIYLMDKNKKFLPSKDLTIYEKTTSYFALVPNCTRLLDWDKLKFSEKKLLAKSMRRLVEDLKKLKSLGLDYKLYSEIEKTRTQKEPVERQKKTTTEIKVFEQPIQQSWKRKEGSYRRGFSGYARPGYYETIEIDKNQDINIKDSKQHVLVLVDNMYKLPAETLEIKMLRYGVLLGLIPKFNIYFVNKSKGVKCLKYFKTLEEKIKETLTETLIAEILRLGSWEDFDRIDFWSRVNFVSNDLQLVQKNILDYQAKKGSVQVVLSDEMKEKYGKLNTLSPVIKKFDEFKRACKMLTLVDSWKFSYKTDILKEYVLLVEKDFIEKGLLT